MRHTKYAELADEDFSGPLTRMTGMPNIAYTSQTFAEFERDEVLAKTWFCVGSLAQFSQPGWVWPVAVSGLPLLMVYETGEVVRVFHNLRFVQSQFI